MDVKSNCVAVKMNFVFAKSKPAKEFSGSEYISHTNVPETLDDLVPGRTSETYHNRSRRRGG